LKVTIKERRVSLRAKGGFQYQQARKRNSKAKDSGTELGVLFGRKNANFSPDNVKHIEKDEVT